MRLEAFFENLELLAETPNGVQKLRELILQLAVQGKLVPQDLNDEPASDLLEKIRFEKEQLIKEGKIKKEKSCLSIKADDIPFEVPTGWEWIRLENLCEVITKGSSPKWQGVNYVEPENGILFITSENIRNYYIELKNPKYVEKKFNQIEPRSVLKRNDILMNIVGASIGRTAIYNSDKIANINQAVCLLRILGKANLINLTYLLHFFNSHICISFMFDKQVDNARANLSMGNIAKFLIPLPPYQEQKRIVAKVDQLMSLCDKLEEHKKKKRETRVLLNNAAINQLLTAREPDTFAKHWQRICDNFDLFYSVPENIGKLRQTILQLAVMGKLVPQDLNDEPASVLLEKIRFEKEQLIKEGKIKKEKSCLSIKADDIPFEVPKGWEWIRLENLCEVITKGSSPKWQGVNYVEPENGILFITSENIRNYYIELKNPKYVEEKFNQIEPRSVLKRNDILMNIVGASIGRTAIYNSDKIANINQAVCLLRILGKANLINLTYLLHFFNSHTCISFMFDKQVDNARANLSMGNIAKFLIPLPPYQEQKRIVAKVDQLMSLCDELEAKLTQSQTDSEKLMDAAVRQLLVV